MPVPDHGKMILDESLYKLEVEKVRHEGKKREKRGTISAMRRYLQTPKGKMLGIVISAASASSFVTVGAEEMLRRRNDIYSIADEELSSDSFAGDRPLSEVRAELTEWLGEDQVRDLLPVSESDRDRNARERRREALRRAPVADVEGLERTGVSEDVVTRYLERGFPRFMTAREQVSSITFTTEHRPMREDYHLGPGAEAAGSCSIGEGEEPSEIVLYGTLFDERGRLDVSTAMMDVLVHELAHAIDWENLDAVDPATRTRMLHHMVSRVRRDESRLHFPYVERITTPDERVRLRNRAIEYYAEFAAAVFNSAYYRLEDDDPFWEVEVTESLVRMYGNPDPADHDDYQAYMQGIRDDVRLVRDIVEAYDPDFSWSDASLARVHLISEMYARRRMADLHEAVSRIPDPVLQTDLHARIEELIETTESPVSDFVRRAGSFERFSEELSTMEPVEHHREARALEQQVQQIQSERITQLESGVLPKDMPAYRALAAIYESLHRESLGSDEASDALRDLIVDYAHAAPQASPAHIEAARRHEEILLGHEGLPRELVRRIENLLGELTIG